MSFEFAPASLSGLMWLLRLRWIACGGILVAASAGVWLYGIQIPWGIVSGAVAAVALTNLVAGQWERRHCPSARLVGVLIFADILILTVLLFFTGGAHNPFTVLYLLHITLAVILLNGPAAWAAVALCGLCFAFLFTSNHMLVGPGGQALCSDLDFHLRGMLAATVVAGAGVVYFVTRLNAVARTQRELAESSRQALEQERRFASVATLAAGLAHELATPLGTIAIASKELENEARTSCGRDSCLADVRLIRQEVDRCRAVLERIGREAVDPFQAGATRLLPADAKDRLAAYLPPGLAGRVHWHIDPETPALQGGENPVLRSLAVLVKNACEASRESDPVEIDIAPDGACVAIRVRDRGCGMGSEVMDRLGEPFFTTKAPGAGMGLGFFLARTLTERLQGSLHVHSRPGEGTCATLRLPAACV